LHPHEDKILDSQLKKQKIDSYPTNDAHLSQIYKMNKRELLEKRHEGVNINNNNDNDIEVDSLENLGHECIEVLIIDNDLSVVKVHEKLLDRFQLKTKHVANGYELNEVLQELIDCK